MHLVLTIAFGIIVAVLLMKYSKQVAQFALFAGLLFLISLALGDKDNNDATKAAAQPAQQQVVATVEPDTSDRFSRKMDRLLKFYAKQCLKDGGPLCGKANAVAARGLSTEEKNCVKRLIDSAPPDQVEASGYSPETIMMAAILGNKCVGE